MITHHCNLCKSHSCHSWKRKSCSSGRNGSRHQPHTHIRKSAGWNSFWCLLKVQQSIFSFTTKWPTKYVIWKSKKHQNRVLHNNLRTEQLKKWMHHCTATYLDMVYTVSVLLGCCIPPYCRPDRIGNLAVKQMFLGGNFDMDWVHTDFGTFLEGTCKVWLGWLLVFSRCCFHQPLKWETQREEPMNYFARPPENMRK